MRSQVLVLLLTYRVLDPDMTLMLRYRFRYVRSSVQRMSQIQNANAVPTLRAPVFVFRAPGHAAARPRRSRLSVHDGRSPDN